MNITAREVGRSLQITLGGVEEGMDEREAEIAERDVRRIIVPPVNSRDGAAIWAHYARILFQTTEEAPEDEAVRMTRLACGAWAEDDATPEAKDRANAQWALIEDLRHDEATKVTAMALYWNAQGGGLDVVKALLEDGHPKAQEALLTANELWNVYSRLKMLTRSRSSAEGSEILERVASNAMTTPTGTSPSDERDAFGLKRSA